MTFQSEAKNQLTILVYHSIVREPLAVPHWCFLDERIFYNQMRTLKDRYSILPLTEAVFRLQHGGLSSTTVAVTFDDGYQNNYDIVFPIVRALEIPATIFLTTSFIQTNATPWFCQLHQMIIQTETPSIVWQDARYDLMDSSAKYQSALRLRAALKMFPQPRLLQELQKIAAMLGRSLAQPQALDSPFRMLDGESIHVMHRSGLIEFGAHTHSHAILSLLPCHEAEVEIVSSIESVQTYTGQPCLLFAYPNGLVCDYDENAIAILKRLRIQISVTAIDGVNDGSASHLELKRRNVGIQPVRSRKIVSQ